MTDFTTRSQRHVTRPHSAPSSPHTARASLSCSRLLEALYREERAGVLAYLKRKVGHEHANDLAQEVFLRAAGSAQLNELRNPGGFLRRIARNLAIDFARRRRCRIVTLPLSENVDGASLPCQEDGLHAAETKQLFEDALAELPAKTARVFAMNRFEKKSYREIHLELGVGVSTVEYHMTKALAHLRRELAAEGD